jgi:branched-chain amino acid transport system substrate-binding protein
MPASHEVSIAAFTRLSATHSASPIFRRHPPQKQDARLPVKQTHMDQRELNNEVEVVARPASPLSDRRPIRIGYCLSLSGALGGNGKSARLAHDIWCEDINRSGGLLNRPVQLICYDDGTDSTRVEALYKQLLDLDKVDFVIGGYGTNSLLPVLPLAIERQLFFVGLMGQDVNRDLRYPGYFAVIPTGPSPNEALTEGFFATAAAQSPKPVTVTLVTADAEFVKNPVLGAKANAEKYGFKIAREISYSLKTEDFSKIIDDVAKSECDVLFICSYLADSVELIRALRAHSFRPKMVGGGMIGPQNTAVKTALGPLLNGVVNYEYWAPVPSMASPSALEMLRKYQARADQLGVDPIGHYMAPLAYAQMQVVAQAVEATAGLEHAALIRYAKAATFKTLVGDITFGPGGEWSNSRVLQVQFQGVVGNEANQFKDGERQAVVSPSEVATGKLIFPYERAL